MKTGKLKVAGIITVAGLSRRMGDFKPLLPYANSSVIETTVNSLQVARVSQIVVVVGFRGNEIATKLAGQKNVYIVNNLNYEQGDMLESIQMGLGCLNDCDAVYILPGDMPAVASATFQSIRTCMEATGASVVFPMLDGRRQHPPLIANRCLERIVKFRGEGGLRKVLQEFAQETAYVSVDDIGCSLDADTPADYVRLLQYQMRGKIF